MIAFSKERLYFSPYRGQKYIQGVVNMKINKEYYSEYVESKSKKSPLFKDCLKAFLFGGTICMIGEGIHKALLYFGVAEENAKIWLPIIMVFLGAALTGFGIYDKLAQHGGAGTSVPITGFSNSMVSSAMEFKQEGWVLGMGAKIFTIAGPVIVYGTIASIIYGIILWIMGML